MPKKKRIYHDGAFYEEAEGKHGYPIFKEVPGYEYLKKSKRRR